MRTVEINGVAYPFRYGYGALMLVEKNIGEPYGASQSLYANFMLMLACFINADKDFPLNFDDLVDACDADYTLYNRMDEEIAWQFSRWGKPSDAEEEGKKKG